MAITTKTQQMRKARLNLLLNTIKALRSVEFSKIIGLMSLNYGFKSDLTREYVNELENAGFVTVKEGVIALSQDYLGKMEAEMRKAKKQLEKREKEMIK